MTDLINRPPHYRSDGGVEVINVIAEYHLGAGFCLGNVVKYILRADKKGTPISDLKKAQWYARFAACDLATQIRHQLRSDPAPWAAPLDLISENFAASENLRKALRLVLMIHTARIEGEISANLIRAAELIEIEINDRRKETEK